MELDDLVFLGACSLLQFKVYHLSGEPYALHPTELEIKLAIEKAKRVWELLCEAKGNR